MRVRHGGSGGPPSPAHNRGSYVALRLTLDHHEAVHKLAASGQLTLTPTPGTAPPPRLWVSTRTRSIRRAIHNPATVHAMLEDYRAGLGVDRAHDEADRAAGRRVTCPQLMLWSLRDDLEYLSWLAKVVHSTRPGGSRSVNSFWLLFANSVSVTEENTNAPETERKIVSVRSYGQQLGRVMDAVAQLIAERPKGAQEVPAFLNFEELRCEVDEIKTRATVERIHRVIVELDRLRHSNWDEYKRLATELRNALQNKPGADSAKS